MSTLVLVLVAGITVPGNGPEKVSAEMERGLDLSGEWEGAWVDHGGKRMRVKLTQDKIHMDTGDAIISVKNSIIGEGNGKFCYDGVLGLYEQDGERLRMCFGFPGTNQRPKSFQKGEWKNLFILHRVKPGK
ncbi:MAG TPA: hypothetical protein VH682_12675 [Gemmataceae bacterium]